MLSPATRAARACAAALRRGAAVRVRCAHRRHGRPRTREVVASFYPLAWVTERVAGDDWTVTNLTTPGGEPHDLELSISATADLAEAALVVYLDGFQPAVDDAVEHQRRGGHPRRRRGRRAAAAGRAHRATRPRPRGGPRPRRPRPALLARPAADGRPRRRRRRRAGRRSTRTTPTTTAPTPRTWSPTSSALDAAYADGLADCERDLVVVSHDAFGYLARYGLHLEPIAGLSPDAEPTPAALAELADLIEDEGVTTVFSERLASPALAETLATDLGVETAVLDPIEGLTDETEGQDYLSLMQRQPVGTRRRRTAVEPRSSTLRDVRLSLGGRPVLHGIDLTVERRRVRRADGCQRIRQVDPGPRRDRPAAGLRGLGRAVRHTAGRLQGVAPDRVRPAAGRCRVRRTHLGA